MVYFGYHLVKAHVQMVQNMYGKGGWGVCKAELRPSEVDPYFERKKITLRGVGKSSGVTILTLERNPPERKFLYMLKNFLSGGFCSKVKIVTAGLFATPPKLIFFLPK